MSRFFRSGGSGSRSSSSSSSSSSSDMNSSGSDEQDADGEVLSNSHQHQHQHQQQRISDAGRSTDALAVDRPRNPSSGDINVRKDWLLHALLEERCVKEVFEERHLAGRSISDNARIQREGRERYQELCAHLAPLNLVSLGMDGDHHIAQRQQVRDGLGRLATAAKSTTLSSARQQSAVPAPLRKLLTNTNSSTASIPPTSLLEGAMPAMRSLIPSRYVQDFDELGLLGKGGFGRVYSVRHKLDDNYYAVKKIPIRPSLMSRIATDGQAALDEVLAEVRSLSKLQHPNVVRYYNSWIEWESSGANMDQTMPVEASSARLGAEQSASLDSLMRVRTDTDNIENIGFTFEDGTSVSPCESTSAYRAESSDAGVLFSRRAKDISHNAFLTPLEPMLALHMQMSVHPMTLAEFLAPPERDSAIQPLVHCFHIGPSLSILVALLDGVEYLHDEGVVHRDLKPANIFLRHEHNARAFNGCVDLSTCLLCRQDGTANPAKLSVCIGDFGLVTQLAQHNASSSVLSNGAVGTEMYRPTAGKSDGSPRLDIFALGIIACELFHKFGTQMERRETLYALRCGHFPEHFADCAGHHANEIKDCVVKMLSYDADDQPSIASLRRCLLDVLSQPQNNSERRKPSS